MPKGYSRVSQTGSQSDAKEKRMHSNVERPLATSPRVRLTLLTETIDLVTWPLTYPHTVPQGSNSSLLLFSSFFLWKNKLQALSLILSILIESMYLASSFPSIKLKLSPPSHPCKSPSRQLVIVRNSKADGPLRRPSVPSLSTPPSLSPPPSPTAPVKPAAPADPAPPTPAPKKVALAERDLKGAVTLEYQRKVAKELQEYFKLKKMEEAAQGPFFGFVGKNEIANGR
jgi:hypothetical protein